jgi:alkylhydroperoxidase family enzyme
VSLDTELVAALKEDWRTAKLDDRDRAMLTYVEKLTRNPPSIWRDDMDALHNVGFDDTGILQITLIAWKCQISEESIELLSVVS